jgi:small subunit ribosomal protein S20
MPNTKSAERRARLGTRRATLNRKCKTRLKTLERDYVEALQAGQKDASAAALRKVSSALDKAAKTGVIHWAKAQRKKSRLAVRLAAAK